MLQIYYADVSVLPDDPGSMLLSSYRLKQLSKCKEPLKRRQGLGAELLLIHALSLWNKELTLPLSIETQAGGKPILSDQSIHFSLSHSGNYVACAISDYPVGVDLEAERPLYDSLLHRVFSEKERQRILNSENTPASFTEAWTRKESFLKATGEGLRAVKRFSVLDPPQNAAFFHTCMGELHLCVCVLDGPAVPDLLEQVDLVNEFSNLAREQ